MPPDKGNIMKKTAFLVIALASFGVCANSTVQSIDQISMIQGCSTDAGTIAVVITPLSGNGYQYIATNKDPLYSSVYDLTKEAVATGKAMTLDYNGTDPNTSMPARYYSYKYTTASGAQSCYKGGFNTINSISLKTR